MLIPHGLSSLNANLSARFYCVNIDNAKEFSLKGKDTVYPLRLTRYHALEA
jgi:hypothetical protein